MSLEFLPKATAACAIYVPAMLDTTDKALRRLCVCRTLNEYVRHTGTFRQDGTSQLFVSAGRQVKGKPISKKQLSSWLVECIKYAYDKQCS